MKARSKKENKKPKNIPKAQLNNSKLKGIHTNLKPTESVNKNVKKNVVQDKIDKMDAATQCSTNEIGVNTESIEPVVNKVEENVKLEDVVEGKDLFVGYRKIKSDSPNAERRMKQIQIQMMQEELKKQMEEKRMQKELEKKRMKEEAEREELRIQNEKKELALKYQSECAVPKTAPKRTNKLFEPSEDNWFAAPSPKSHQPINVIEGVKEKPLDVKQLLKEYEKRIKQLEVEKDNAIKMAMAYKEKLIKERTRKGNLVPLDEDGIII